MRSVEEITEEYRTNDPPIEPGQIWVSIADDGRVLRRILILAQYPPFGMKKENKRVWIYEEQRGGAYYLEVGQLRVIPEFNLRYVSQLEEAESTT